MIDKRPLALIQQQEEAFNGANCKTIFLNSPASSRRDFPTRFRDDGRILVGYGGGIMVNLILRTWGCRTGNIR